jgi:AraC-like DNA-binding protein
MEPHSITPPKSVEKITDGFKGEKAIVTPYSVRNYQTSNLITKQLYVTHIGYYSKVRFHFRECPAGCLENILIYCEDGAGCIMSAGEKYDLTPNSAFIIPANTPHTYKSDHHNPWSIYWIHFLGENTNMFASIIGRIIHVEKTDKRCYKDCFQLFEEMFQNLEMGYSPENLEYVSFCLMYLLASLKYINQFQEIKNVKESDVIRKSILYMKDNLENKITLEDMAGNINYSLSHFGNLFLAKTSYSPMEYYNQLKIQRACSYLLLSDLKIKEIAFRLNYYDPFHFSKAFKQKMEITPKEYRERYRNPSE